MGWLEVWNTENFRVMIYINSKFAALQDVCMSIIIGETCVSMSWDGICYDILLAKDFYLTIAHELFTVEDVSDLWPTVKNSFEEQLPLKRALLK